MTDGIEENLENRSISAGSALTKGFVRTNNNNSSKYRIARDDDHHLAVTTPSNRRQGHSKTSTSTDMHQSYYNDTDHSPEYNDQRCPEVSRSSLTDLVSTPRMLDLFILKFYCMVLEIQSHGNYL
jgi:hypothetical protein